MQLTFNKNGYSYLQISMKEATTSTNDPAPTIAVNCISRSYPIRLLQSASLVNPQLCVGSEDV